jgi:hypothetical protein
LGKISEILAGPNILSTPIFVTFLHGGPVQMCHYSARESLPIKAGWPVATPNLVTALGEDNIFKKENISEVWENRTLPGQNRKKMLLRMRQHFVDVHVLSTPTFC